MFDFLITKFAISIFGIALIILSFSAIIYVIIKKIISFMNKGMTIYNGKALHWNKSDIPLTIIYMSDLPKDYILTIKHCCYKINNICKRKIFNPDVKQYIKNECNSIKILFRVFNNKIFNQCNEYYTNHQWNKKTGRILSCGIYIGNSFHGYQLQNIIYQILFRILGLKCNYSIDSIMCKKSIKKQFQVNPSDKDKKIIRRHYG